MFFDLYAISHVKLVEKCILWFFYSCYGQNKTAVIDSSLDYDHFSGTVKTESANQVIAYIIARFTDEMTQSGGFRIL